ncbi:MAG: response regulator [Myxococcota bacterium]
MEIKIAIVDDHPVVREGIKNIIKEQSSEIIVNGEASNGKEFLTLYQRQKSDVYLVDISIPHINGIEVTRRIIEINPDAKILIMSFHEEKKYVKQSFLVGAKGYFLKEDAIQSLVRAIKDIYKGGKYISPKVAGYVINGFISSTRKEVKVSSLTTREREVLKLIGEAHTSKCIADRLGITTSTVNTHIKKIKAKTGKTSRTELVRLAIQEDITK